MKRFVLAFAAIAVTTISASASAQVWLRDRASTQGPGIRSGDLEYHPGIGVELGYDSNYFQRSPGDTSGYPVVDTVKLRVTPSFHVSTLTTQRTEGAPTAPPKFSFNGGAALIYSEYLTNTAITAPAGPNLGAGGLGRNRDFGIAADLALGIAPGRPWGFNIIDQFTRTAQPSLDPDPNVGLDRDDNRATGELVYTKPGGLLDWHFGYTFGITYFESAQARSLTNDQHTIFTKGRWKFLPRTAFIYDGNVTFIRYTNATTLSDSTPIRTRVGLNGLFTDRLSLLFLVGWGASFYNNAPVGGDFDSVIGQVEARYFLTGSAPEAGAAAPSTSSFAVGFTRDFYNYFIGNFYERDRGYMSLSALFSQKFFLSLEAGVAAIRYSAIYRAPAGPGTTAGIASTGFTDTRVDATLFGEYRAKDWLGFNATAQYLGEYSTTTLALSTPNGRYDPRFNRFQLLVGVRAAF